MSSPSIRRADPSESETISDLALRSKAHWGYPPDFIEACRTELTLSEEFVSGHPVFVLELEGRIVGFYALSGAPPEGELRDVFLDPSVIGRGFGRTLWNHAMAKAEELGFESLTIDADPNAEPFYAAMGAVRIGEMPSGSIEGRMLPLLRVDVTAGS